MLLEEVDYYHKGTYDFFYLPIDFKNRCNVGYCFINFLESKLILPFITSFNGNRWKNFNSEKICSITFARIQGRQAMISRFQNSSLLEKHDDYRPLLFFSSGPDRGNPEPFPLSIRHVKQPKEQFYSRNPNNNIGNGYYSDQSSGHDATSSSTDQYDEEINGTTTTKGTGTGTGSFSPQFGSSDERDIQ